MTDKFLEKKISRFSSVFSEYVGDVSRMTFKDGDNRYQKILYFTLIEGLANAKYPNRHPGKAFASFIRTCCEWKNDDRVSLPHIVAALERTSEPVFKDIREYAFCQLRKWDSGGPLSLNQDLEKSDVQRHWPKKEDGSTLKIPELDFDWTACQHRKLLYAYRSKLSHESREPTISFEKERDLNPFYESVEMEGSAMVEWHLVYPSNFLMQLCQTGIENLKKWLLAEKKDPYKQIQFGHYLIDKLNDSKVPFNTRFRL